MSFKLLVFDSHPVQYRVPIWQTMDVILPGSLHVVYASDCSVRGFNDTDFGQTFAWDEPMLSGYHHTILNCEKGKPLENWKSLTGKGVSEQIKDIQPDAILLTGFNYRYDLIAYMFAKLNNIPVWLRNETQDYAFNRSKFKSTIRSAIYRVLYQGLDKVFFIGELNRRHFLKHGVPLSRLKPAHYGTVDRFRNMSETDKIEFRNYRRQHSHIPLSDVVIGFSGKFISKKNPDILFEMLKHLSPDLRSKTHLYFIGSGPLENELRDLANRAFQQFGIRTNFTGFLNQSELPAHYLAMDILVLPSRRMGETWGLVCNEAMQAGCSVIVSDAVGCGADFKNWKKFKIFREGNALELAECVSKLACYPREFNWAQNELSKFSIRAAAEAFVQEMRADKNIELAVTMNK